MTTRYMVRQKMFSIGDDFWVENEDGKRVYKVDGKVLRIRKTLTIEDLKGKVLCQIKERLMTIKDTMVVEDADGNDLAVIKKSLLTPIRSHWEVKVTGAPDLEVQGDILDHEYSIKQGWNKIAEISRKWFRFTDTYGIEIDEGQNDVLILAIAVAIDAMNDEEEEAEKKRKKENKEK